LQIDLFRQGDATPSSAFVVVPSNILFPSVASADLLTGLVGLIFLVYLREEFIQCITTEKYLNDAWNLFEVVISLCGLAWTILQFASRFLAVEELEWFKGTDQPIDSRILDLFTVAWLYSASEFAASLTLMGFFIRFIKYLQLLPFIGPDMNALVRTLVSTRVMTFTLFVLFFIVSIAVGVYIRFGSTAVEFASFSNSLLSIYGFLTGESYFDAMRGGGPDVLLQIDRPNGSKTTATFFFISISFLMSIILANIFINVTGAVYDETHSRSLAEWSEEVNSLMITDVWRMVRGLPANNIVSKAFHYSKGIIQYFCHRLNLRENDRLLNYDWSSASQAVFLEGKIARLEKELDEIRSALAISPTALLDKLKHNYNNRLSNKREDTGLGEEDSNRRTTQPNTLTLDAYYWDLNERTRRLRIMEIAISTELTKYINELKSFGPDIYPPSATWWAKEKKRKPNRILLSDYNPLVAQRWRVWKEINASKSSAD
jgi:hypothetical protein